MIESFLLFGAGAATYWAVNNIASSFWKPKASPVAGLTFGVALFENGVRSQFEHILIDELCAQGATCVLAGRSTVRSQIQNVDILDTLNIANPQFAIIGTIREMEVFYVPQYYFSNQLFHNWVKEKYPLAFRGNCHFGNDRLELHYKLTLSQLFKIYNEETGQNPYSSDSERKFKLQISADCHSAQGVVVGSCLVEREFQYPWKLDTYRAIAKKIISGIHVGSTYFLEGQNQTFRPDQLDQIVAQYAPMDCTERHSTTLLTERLPAEELIVLDSPMKTQCLKES